jgi:hypothetical protein
MNKQVVIAGLIGAIAAEAEAVPCDNAMVAAAEENKAAAEAALAAHANGL